MKHPTEELNKIVVRLNKGKDGKGEQITPRFLLNQFGQERRTKFNNVKIKKYLKASELECDPDFVAVYMDAPIMLKKKKKVSIKKHQENEEEVRFDPVTRLQLLTAANRTPVSVKTESDIKEATTLMMLHGYSQLPVMNNERNVEGMLNWESISQNLIHRSIKEGKVMDYMTKDFKILDYDTPLFDAVKVITKHQVALVKKPDKTICGLVTTTDIGEQFVTLAEPFLILEQIENHIRIILDGKFTLEKIRESCHNDKDPKLIETISDLTFGQYIRVLENPTNWKNLDLFIDRATFIKKLEEIKRIRNDVMHFHPDGISESDIQNLRGISSFFMKLGDYV